MTPDAERGEVTAVAETSTGTHTIALPDRSLTLSWAEVTHQGRKREVNQDAVLVRFPLFVVADGMGGHIGGEIASASTVARLRETADAGEVSPQTIEQALIRAVDSSLLDEWEARTPGRRQVMFRALSNVRPSHLLDPNLFDFSALLPESSKSTEFVLPPDAEH